MERFEGGGKDMGRPSSDLAGKQIFLVSDNAELSGANGLKLSSPSLSFPFYPGELRRPVREILLGTLPGVAASGIR